jgi:type I restriction enzyme S subunit
MKKGWETRKLQDVCGFQNGFAFKSNTFRESGCPILRISNIQDEKVDTEKLVFFDPRDYRENLDRYRIVKGDLLIAMSGATTGKIGFNNEDTVFYLNQRVGKFEPSQGLIKQFLFYFLSTKVEENLRISAGAAQPNLSTEQIKDFAIPVPPLAEQQRIVGVLDEAFAGLATAQAHAAQNLQNARALFESHLQSVFTHRGKGWVEKRLREMSRINYGYTESASSEKVGPHFLRITDIQDNRVDWETVPYCRIEKADLPKYKLADGDIVFARTGATTGKSYLVSEPPDAVFASYLIRVQLAAKEFSPRFLNLFFQTQSYWSAIRAGVSGSAQGGFNATKLGELVIPFPSSAKEQQEVVTQLDALTAETQRLTRLYEQKQAALAALKKSLLHQAFTGEL